MPAGALLNGLRLTSSASGRRSKRLASSPNNCCIFHWSPFLLILIILFTSRFFMAILLFPSCFQSGKPLHRL